MRRHPQGSAHCALDESTWKASPITRRNNISDTANTTLSDSALDFDFLRNFTLTHHVTCFPIIPITTTSSSGMSIFCGTLQMHSLLSLLIACSKSTKSRWNWNLNSAHCSTIIPSPEARLLFVDRLFDVASKKPQIVIDLSIVEAYSWMSYIYINFIVHL